MRDDQVGNLQRHLLLDDDLDTLLAAADDLADLSDPSLQDDLQNVLDNFDMYAPPATPPTAHV